MGANHRLGGVGNQVTGDQTVLHALVAHGNTVAHRNGREHNGRTACHGNTQLDGIDDFIQVHMSGDDLIIGADNANQRALLLLFGQSQSMVQTPMGSIAGAVDNGIFNHSVLPSFLLIAQQGRVADPPLLDN